MEFRENFKKKVVKETKKVKKTIGLPEGIFFCCAHSNIINSLCLNNNKKQKTKADYQNFFFVVVCI